MAMGPVLRLRLRDRVMWVDQRNNHAPPALSALLEEKRLPALTGLRAVLVASVVLYHAGVPLPGSIGVTGFFVLSGFLITRLLLQELDATGTISYRKFFIRRALRIFPAYYAFLALSIGIDLALDDERIIAAIPWALTYTMNYYNALYGHPPISIAHAWSLAIEEQFYLIWPLAMLAVVRWNRRALPWVLGGLVLAVMVWRSFAWGVLDLGDAHAYNAFDTRFDSLAIGCLFAVIAPRLTRMRGSSLTVVALCVLIWYCDYSALRYTIGFSAASVLLAVLMLQLMLLSGHPLWRWIESKPVVYLGTISYGIYLYHIVGLSVGGKLGSTAAGILVTIVVAAASYHLLESPILRLRDRTRRGSAVPAPAPRG